MTYNGAEILIRLLERQGIDAIPGIPGGANLPMYAALRSSRIRHILTRHEQGAGFIAQGMARASGRAAVCFATSGPGAVNLLTAIADAKLDSVPLVAITGQVPTGLLGTDAFQEIDTYGLTLPITKHNFLIRRPEELLTVIPEAFRIAQSGRPGPVAVDIPKDVQLARLEVTDWPEPGRAAPPEPIDAVALEAIAQAIAQAERPVIYAGGGIIHADAQKALQVFARTQGIPVAVTLMALGCFPPEDPLYLGMLGMHGARFTNLILKEADLLLAFGARFDDRATGKVAEFCPKARIVHIDIDRAEISKIKTAHWSIPGDIGEALAGLNRVARPHPRPQWQACVQDMKARFPFRLPHAEDGGHPCHLLLRMADMVPEDTIVTTDVGQHQMWTAQVYPFRHSRTLLTSGGLGTMGFGLPAAIGASLAFPGRKVVCVSGDGSLLMNIQELATLADLGLNVTVILMNNGHLGLVRQQQELFYEGKYLASRFSTDTDFPALARGFGIPAVDLGTEREPEKALARALAQEGPSLVNIPIEPAVNVFPMVAPGGANHHMIGGE